MKRLVAVLGVVLVSGCLGHPINLSSPTLLPADTVYSCVVQQAVKLKYSVTNTAKDTGAINAEKLTRSWTVNGIGTNVRRDRLTVTVHDVDAVRTVSVVATTEKEVKNLLNDNKSQLKPSDQVQSDARTLLTACNGSAPRLAATKPETGKR